MRKTRIIFYALFPYFLLFNAGSWASQGIGELQLSLPKVNWLLSPVDAPLGDREARLAPEEYSLGQQLRPLLDSQNYRAAAQLLADNQSSSDSAALQLVRGQIYLSLKNYPKAEIAFKAAIKAMPDFARAHRSLSMVSMLAKKYDQARIHLAKAIELGVADAQVFGQLAYLNLQSASPWSAISGYQQALYLEPKNIQWQQGLLYSLINAEDFSQAMALLEEMLESRPDDTTLWLQRSNIAIQKKQFETALTSIEMALRLGERNADTQMVAAQLHMQHGSVARAVELMSASIKRSMGQFEAVAQAIGVLQYQGQWRSADTLLKAANSQWRQLSTSDKSLLRVVRPFS